MATNSKNHLYFSFCFVLFFLELNHMESCKICGPVVSTFNFTNTSGRWIGLKRAWKLSQLTGNCISWRLSFQVLWWKFELQQLCIRLILLFSWRFGSELVVLHTKKFMFSMFLVHAWTWCGGLNKELSMCRFMPRGFKMNLAPIELI